LILIEVVNIVQIGGRNNFNIVLAIAPPLPAVDAEGWHEEQRGIMGVLQ
jgi:hypothetical protein